MFEFNHEEFLIGDPQLDGITQLQSFCRGEMSAVETYRLAIKSTQREWMVKHLWRNLACHESRVGILRARILELGGAPPASSGPWGTFATMAEGVALAISESAALSILEEGERHGVTVYQRDLLKLDEASQRLVSEKIVPRQVDSHNALEHLRRVLAA